MKHRDGFTLVELLVVIAIIGIMSVTAIPLYRTFQQRTYGSEATLMVKQILEAQIIYFLEHDTFYPKDDSTIMIVHDDLSSDNKIKEVFDNLKITIPVGHFLDFNLAPANIPGDEFFTVTVQVTSGKNFPLFTGGFSPGSIIGSVNKDGKVTTFAP